MNHCTTSPLLSGERIRLEDLLREKKTSFTGYIIFWILAAPFFPLIPSRRQQGRDWPPSWPEYAVKVLLCEVLLVGFSIWAFKTKTRNFKRDLALGTKIICQCTVLDKRHSGETFSISIDTEDDNFKSFHISQAEYERIQAGQFVTLEYAQYSRYLFKTDWRG